MGSLFSVCRRNPGGLAELGIPHEYEWDGLSEDLIEQYEEAKETAIEELQKSEGDKVQLLDGQWIQRVSMQAKEKMKHLLLERSVALVHVLKPIEETRRGLRALQMRGYLPGSYFSSFEQAEALCQRELQSVMEESRLLAPELPPNAIMRTAVQVYHQRNPAADDNEEEGKAFGDVKRGFFKSGGKKEEVKLAHGFPIGSEVESHSLQTESMNGLRGTVKCAKGDRVAVAFPDPIGEKALKPANLKRALPMPEVHPDAREAPVAQFQVTLNRQKDETLGVRLTELPPPAMQQKGQESCLQIEGILDEGPAQKHNAAQTDPRQRLCRGDRIMAVMDCSVPEKNRRPMGGSSKLMLEVIAKGNSPLVLFMGRLLGPPLRFKVGQQVKANCGERGWLAGNIVKLWDEDEGDGAPIPYVIRLTENGNVVFAPKDSDDYVVKGENRFTPGDEVVASVEGGYKKGNITEVHDGKISTSYKVKIIGDPPDKVWTIPEDLNRFARPVARFKKGTKVLAKCEAAYVPGTIDAVYHPNWVYAIRLDAGNVVFCPEDTDSFVKKR